MTLLESRMTTYINQVEPSLLTSGNGGALQEIIQLAGCIQKFAKALGDRAKSPSASPSPSHS